MTILKGDGRDNGRTSRHRAAYVLLACVFLAPGLSGCNSVRQAMGFDKVRPDEFAIVTKAPLVMPPDFALRPPREGESDLTANQPKQSAEQAVFASADGGHAAQPEQSIGEQALLAQAGATNADPVIRRIVARESVALADKDRHLADKILFWRSEPVEATTVNAEDEAKRLRENAAAGNPPNVGATPATEGGKDVKIESKY
jgi:hypothetical protein